VEAFCLIGSEDEAYTYNSRINRLSTIQDMDRILVFHKGRLREQGSHQELLALRGIYYRLYQLQYHSELTTNAWVSLYGTNIVGTGSIVCFPERLTQPQRFYRLLCVTNGF